MSTKPDPEKARDFAYKIGLLYLRVPFSVTSWWRTPKRNAVKGGLANSAHQWGLAVDAVPDDDADRAALINHARSLGLEVEEKPECVHLEEGGTRYRTLEGFWTKNT